MVVLGLVSVVPLLENFKTRANKELCNTDFE